MLYVGLVRLRLVVNLFFVFWMLDVEYLGYISCGLVVRGLFMLVLMFFFLLVDVGIVNCGIELVVGDVV